MSLEVDFDGWLRVFVINLRSSSCKASSKERPLHSPDFSSHTGLDEGPLSRHGGQVLPNTKSHTE